MRLLVALHQARWREESRPEQRPPEGDWRIWYVRGGRGSGKTRTGAETLAEWIFEHEPGDWAIVAPTFADARDVCTEGRSGLLKAAGGWPGPLVTKWNRSIGEVELVNGSRVYLDGADDGALRVQGKNLRGAWCDEIGLWRAGNWKLAWTESLGFAVRLESAKVIATATPKAGHPLVGMLLDDPQTATTHMSMLANAANLDPEAVAEFLRRHPPGSRMFRQEVEGEYITETIGALWELDLLERLRITPEQLRVSLAGHGMSRVVVGVDPSGSADEDDGSSECGIAVAGYSAHTGHGYVLGDKSLRASPSRWAQAVVSAYRDHRADRVVAEKNFGGEMVRAVINTVDANVPVTLVSASRGKVPRAEPVAALYERELIHHVGVYRELEDQMCSYVAESGMDSPDRMDALVWALSELMVAQSGGKQYDAYGLGGPPVTRRGDLVLVGEKYIDK